MPSAAAPRFEAIAPEAAGMPLYRIVKRSLLSAIESGACPPGQTLPSETEIAGAMGVSIGTLRRAVDELAAEHVVVRRQGRGTFVATHGVDRFLLQFFHVERADGTREAPRSELLAFERTQADAEAASALRLQPGDAVFVVVNRLLLQGAPVVRERSVLPAASFKGLTEKRLREHRGSVYQLYQSAFGVSVLGARERARAAAADRHVAQALGIAPGQPVIQVRRTALSFNERPVEYRVSIINTAHHDYVNVLSGHAAAPP